jgi:Flp pilus assembly protein protease CpaA
MITIFSILAGDAFFIALLIWCAYTDIRTRTVPNTAVILLLCLGLTHTVLIGLSAAHGGPTQQGMDWLSRFSLSG